MLEAAPTVSESVDSAASDAVASFMQANAPADSGNTPPDPSKPQIPAAPVAKTKPADAPRKEKDPTEVDEPDTDEDAQDEVALPEGYAAVATVKDGLVTEFSIRDAEGEIEVPDLTIEYKANGRVRKDRLDQVVKLAQFDVYNVEREQKLVAREQAVQEEASQVKQLLSTRESQLEAILQDPEVYEMARERYMQANAPENQVQRLQNQLRERDTQQARQQVAMQSRAFIEQEVAPALSTIAEACPEVTVEELGAQLSLAMYSLMENGQVPPHKYPMIRQYIIHQLTDWAEDTHARRYSRVASVQQTAGKEVEQAKVVAQKAKRQVARATKPMGRGGAPTQGTAPRSNAPVSVDSAVDDAMADVMAGIGRLG